MNTAYDNRDNGIVVSAMTRGRGATRALGANTVPRRSVNAFEAPFGDSTGGHVGYIHAPYQPASQNISGARRALHMSISGQ